MVPDRGCTAGGVQSPVARFFEAVAARASEIPAFADRAIKSLGARAANPTLTQGRPTPCCLVGWAMSSLEAGKWCDELEFQVKQFPAALAARETGSGKQLFEEFGGTAFLDELRKWCELPPPLPMRPGVVWLSPSLIPEPPLFSRAMQRST